MRIQGKQAIGENLLYVMVWAAIILVPVLNSQMMSEMHIKLENVLIAWRQIAPYLIIFVIHNSILAPRFMLRRKYWKYLISNLALIIIVFWVVQIYEEHIADNLFFSVEDPGDSIDAYRKASFSNLEMYWNVVLGFFMTGANTGIKLIYQSMRDEQKMEALKRQNLQAEMDYLKYQINPHFFMNTLNNIHALIDIDAESAKNAVIELSKMMRYVLYDSGSERISLNRDIQFLKNYIELMRIRYTDAVDIRMEYPQHLPESVSIPPLLLIVFVENAFKHGVSYNRESFIRLRIEYRDGEVCSTVENSLPHPGNTSHVAGIGLENVRKRLALIYGEENFTLETTETNDTYSVKLIIPILHA
ncbi:MAG TPA: histidine kinase [Candidatus Alistipes intestinipullorum]|nr:histidine kinase [Candidatus Alistipes intestinipullorum]